MKIKFWKLSRKDRIMLIRNMSRKLTPIQIAKKLKISKKVVDLYMAKEIWARDIYGKDTNIIVKIYFKLEEYGKWGHFLWINCYLGKVFHPDTDYSEIDAWESEARVIILRDVGDYFGDWVYDTNYVWAREVETTHLYEGTEESKYEYSHNGRDWKDFA